MTCQQINIQYEPIKFREETGNSLRNEKSAVLLHFVEDLHKISFVLVTEHAFHVIGKTDHPLPVVALYVCEIDKIGIVHPEKMLILQHIIIMFEVF